VSGASPMFRFDEGQAHEVSVGFSLRGKSDHRGLVRGNARGSIRFFLHPRSLGDKLTEGLEGQVHACKA
jgi:hypothetical protein